MSAPYSPHQNATAERNWRTLFEMARCMIIENSLLKNSWAYAVTTSAITRNMFQQPSETNPIQYDNRRKFNLSKMHIFRSTCYDFKNLRKKLDPKCEKGIFVGYDRNSHSYLIFYPGNKRILKHRLVKFITKMTNQQTQTYPTNNDEDDEEDDFLQKKNIQKQKSVINSDPQIKISDSKDNTQIEEDSKLRHYPGRERCWLVGFYGISNFVGYLTPNSICIQIISSISNNSV